MSIELGLGCSLKCEDSIYVVITKALMDLIH